MRKIFVAGAAVLALLMNSPQVSADDDIVIFGGEFEDETSSPPPKKVKKPAPIKESPKPPVEKPTPPPKPEPVEPQDKPPTQPLEQPPPPEDELLDKPFEQPQQPVEQPNEEPPTEISSGQERVPAPVEIAPVKQPAPSSEHTVIKRPPTEIQKPPVEIPDEISPSVVEPVVIVPPPIETAPQPIEPPRRQSTRSAQPQKNLKMLKQRFIKLAVDDTYIYYLDKTSVQWRKMPYSSSEYIADVWVRMIERNPKPLGNDMAVYGADNFNAEISLAHEQGYQYSPEDLKVLRSQAYVLEHYYLRPKTNQIQFLSELEVFGRPQNTVNERTYDYKNWENLVPGSIESVIYAATIKIIGKSKSTERGHMTFIDMLDEYARIALN